MELIDKQWKELLKEQFDSIWYEQLKTFVNKQYDTGTCYPPQDNIFRALELCPPSKLKVVIVGQDPYHNFGQANGLCFSSISGKLPPSLNNIYKELISEYPDITLQGGDLSSWASQGVLMLNTCLTVRENQPNSHSGQGWEKLTKAIIDVANAKDGIVFMLWGNPAQKLVQGSCRNKNNLYLTSAHPSPLSAYRGFLGNGHFDMCNRYLIEQDKMPIDWNIR